MKRVVVLCFLAGLCLFTLVIAYSGAGEVWKAAESAGWATCLVVLARSVAVATDGLAWRLLFPVGRRISRSLAVLLRWIREATNQLLPVAQVGGDFIGARLATFWGHDGALSGASVVVDVAIQAGTQFLFAVVGLLILVALEGSSDLVGYISLGLLVAALGLIGFFAVQRREGSRLVAGLLRRVAGGRDGLGVAAIDRLYGQLGGIYARKRGIALCTAIHMAVWIFASVEVWVSLRFMGHPVTAAQAIVIESLGQAVRGAAFAIPGALGVQEGGFVALCAIFGIPAGPALALSLVKRVADLALGVPGLLAWQAIEGRRILGRARADSAPAADGKLAEAGR